MSVYYKQDDYLIDGNSQINIQVGGDGYQNFMILKANHNDYEIWLNGSKIGKIEARIGINAGVVINDYKIVNKSSDDLKITVAVSLKSVVDSRSELSGNTLKVDDDQTQIKLRELKTETTAVKTAVESVGTKLDGKYMAGVAPIGKNVVSVWWSSKSAIVKSGSNGMIIRTLTLHSQSGGGHGCLVVGGVDMIYSGNHNTTLYNLYIQPDKEVYIKFWGSFTYEKL